MELVEVHWQDITTYAGWQEAMVELELDVPLEFVTVGYLVRKSKDRVVITDTSPTIGNITIFPRGCVQKIVFKEKTDEAEAKKQTGEGSKGP